MLVAREQERTSTMAKKTNRRTFMKSSLAAPATVALSMSAGAEAVSEAANAQKTVPAPPADGDALPQGKIGGVQVSRLLLGGNLLTHYTHSRDLKYVYNLAAHYNTEEKILDTLSLAERHGVNTLVIHTVDWSLDVLKKHRFERGGKIQWIICPTAPVAGDMAEYRNQVKALADDGVEAIYLWGVHADRLVAGGQSSMIATAVEIAKEHGLPSGVGAHDLRVIQECEAKDFGADFYIKTFHHHKYPTAPKPHEIKGPYNEFPGYWCCDPLETIEFMQGVEKPWIAFKVMAAGAIPPDNAFKYALEKGADHILAGMFDFEIAQDAALVRDLLPTVERTRPWRS
jgi:hypothetical protein